jgi:hypothetical protein
MIYVFHADCHDFMSFSSEDLCIDIPLIILTLKFFILRNTL